MGYELVAWPFTLTAALLMLVLPRRWAIVPLFLVAFFLTLAQRVIIFGLNFPMTRLIILVGFVRLFLQSPNRHPKLDAIGKAMILWVIASITTYTLLWQSWGALINRLGVAYDALGLYFLVLGFVVDFEDIERVIKAFAFVSILIAVAMLVERATGRNAFAVFGGVPLVTDIREGRLRCQGAFLHPIMAGTFGAALFPLFVSLGWGRKHKVLAVLGVTAATIIMITSSSSGPLLSYLAGIVGFCMWPLRKRMRAIRWGILLAIIGLHAVMKAPVWALVGRASIVPGSTAYQRAFLIDQFIRRFGEWWLVGTTSTRDWGPWYLETQDLTNQYIRVGVDGGLITLALFILVVGLCFRAVGRARKAFENQPAMERLCWAFGVSLFVHMTAFMGVSYFDQVIVVWYAGLALISRLASLTENRALNQRERFAHAASIRMVSQT